MKLRVALCQFDMAWERVNENLHKTEGLVAAADADLVVLPEMFATGFVTEPERVAQPMDGVILQSMVSMAKHHKKAVTGSAIISEGSRFYNRQLFVFPSGDVVWSDKRHPFSIGGEREQFVRGERRVVVEFGGFRILLLVCYDLRFPVWSRSTGDYDAAIYSASWPSSRRDVWMTLLRARAIENQAYTIGVNRVGSDLACNYSGDSAAVDFMGRTMTDLADGERIEIVTLDSDALHQYREQFPVWKDADHFEIK